MNSGPVPGLLFSCGLLFAATLAAAQPLAEGRIELNGETVRYSLRRFAPNAHLVDPALRLEPTSALNTAILVNRYLSAGDLEEAALLSNAPRRRFERFEDYRIAVGTDAFRHVFAQYFLPENRIVAEVAIRHHRLLIWHLKDANRFVGQYYVDVEGRYLIDDAPSKTRSQLQYVLEAYRTGTIAK